MGQGILEGVPVDIRQPLGFRVWGLGFRVQGGVSRGGGSSLEISAASRTQKHDLHGCRSLIVR